jgi:predicted  nucleic acid-binding Zn-ribbon protein
VVLEKNLGYLAEGNYDELLNSHLHVKKPIMEIQSIADSTNILLDKMHEFNKTISQQNELLEKQNAELEAQNNELTASRKQISDAQTLLVQNQNLASGASSQLLSLTRSTHLLVPSTAMFSFRT